MDYTIHIKGVAPLIPQSDTLVDPLHPLTREYKALTGLHITKKNATVYANIARLEWTAALYFDDDLGPYIPNANIWKSLYEGAGKVRGTQVLVEQGALRMLDEPGAAIEYDGPRDRKKLWADENHQLRVSVNANPSASKVSRTMRCRPLFTDWALTFHVMSDPERITKEQLTTIVEKAGEIAGIGTWRPRNGRYDLVSVKHEAA